MEGGEPSDVAVVEPSDPTNSGTKDHSFVNETEAKRFQRMAEAVAEGAAPPWAAVQLKKAAPVIGAVGAGVQTVAPLAMQCGVGIYATLSWLPREQLKGLWGLGVCFYGGRYAVTIAALEAFKEAGGEQTIQCAKEFWGQVDLVMKAYREDDVEDLDEDGVPDVQGISAKELATRKTALVLRTVDPEILSRSLSGLWTGYMGVLAVVKFQFARTVALAHSIGDCIRPLAAKVFAPTLLHVLPPEYHKWANPIVNFGSKTLAGFVAWKIQYMISTVQSGVKGGLLASRGFLPLLTSASMDETFVDEIAGYSLAAVGIYFQFKYSGLPLPFFAKPLLWPLDLLEWWMQFSVTWIVKDEQRNTAATPSATTS